MNLAVLQLARDRLAGCSSWHALDAPFTETGGPFRPRRLAATLPVRLRTVA
jgi:hypothetical protein